MSGIPRDLYLDAVTIQVVDADGTTAQAHLSLSIALPGMSRLLLTQLSDPLAPATQVPIAVSLEQPALLPLSGSLSLAFAADRVGREDSALALIAGIRAARSLPFSVAQGATAATFDGSATASLQTGSSSGTLTLTATLAVPGANPITTSSRSRVSALAPVITSARLVRRDQYTIEIEVVGYSTTAEVHTALFTFAGTGQIPPQQTLEVRHLFDAWYLSEAGKTEGGTYRYAQRFNFNTNSRNISAVDITLTNSVGPSEPYRLALP